MRNLLFDSYDLGATEDFLVDAYTSMSITDDSARGVRTRVRRDMLGPVSLDRLRFGFDMSYDADALHKVCLCTMHSGSIEETVRDTGVGAFVPGEIGMLTPPELPYSGVVRSADYSVTMFDTALLDRAAADARTPVRITGPRPVSAAAGRLLSEVVEHLRRLAADPDACSDLVSATAVDYLTATVLHTMPTTAVVEPTTLDRRDARPDTVRRAVAYIESHLGESISVVDIAAAACVTVRALQLAFRRHLDTTPARYLRRLRLAAAHEHLIAADPADGATVTSVAYEWGFAHPGRFAIAYRRAYGCAPVTTLRS
ncbi:helix-turn-helix domain-containing protein [Nocardia bovistercoris]|uniref:Helix-turn-helix transcriptional regulator n=1 Tax=Nocardia bovistercoris TaxID=2785916 RepID=A0A931I8C5_9NOCA|nr:AraC family transcriptional regulator [Nocardia bovistercoris]MBH0776802.1 helix-turn-helix transcriptional regulator [Nocardia bovistercoris]